MRGPSCRPSTTISVSGAGAPASAVARGSWARAAAAPTSSNAHPAAARSPRPNSPPARRRMRRDGSVVGRQWPRRGFIARVVHAGEIHRGPLFGRDVELRHQMLAVRRQAVTLGHVRTQLPAPIDYVLPALPGGGLVRHPALRRDDTARAGDETALRGAIVEHELPGPLPYGEEIAAGEAHERSEEHTSELQSQSNLV